MRKINEKNLAKELSELAKKNNTNRKLTTHEKKIKIPVQLTNEMLDVAYEGKLSCAKFLIKGNYIAAYIADKGIRIPSTAICFKTLEEAEKSCLVNNRRFNYSKDEIYEIMEVSGLFQTLNNTLKKDENGK